MNPLTGYYRNGKCHTGPGDHGLHVICVQVTDTFLKFGQSRGNDLITPVPDFQFPGLKDGDCWCVCLSRWVEALEAGCAPPVKLTAAADLDPVPNAILTESDVPVSLSKATVYAPSARI